MRSFKIVLLSFTLALAIMRGNASEAPKPPQVIRITPQGNNIPEAGQIVIEFDQPMVKLGQPVAKDIPVTVTPEVQGDWQWLNEKTLSLNVRKETGLKKATNYKVIVKPGLKSLAQTELADEVTHEFTTSLPQPRWFSIHTWKGPQLPLIQGGFSEAVTKESVEKSLFFIESANPEKKISVKVISNSWDDAGNLKPPLKINENWIIEPERPLAANTKYKLYLEPGVMIEGGTVPSQFTGDLIEFKTFDAFKLIGFRCRLNDQPSSQEAVIFNETNPQTPERRCNPLQPISLLFTTPVKRSTVAQNIEINPDPTAGKKDIDLWGGNSDFSALDGARNLQAEYSLPLPYGLKADSTYTVTIKQAQLSWWQKLVTLIKGWFSPQPQTMIEDEFGRKLERPSAYTIMLDNRKPNFVIANHLAVLEKQADSEVPLYVNNLKSAEFNYHGFTVNDEIPRQVMAHSIPEVRNVQFAIPFKIRDILGGKSGVVLGSLTTNPVVEKYANNEHAGSLFAQVTPFQVQIKQGHYNTVAWVVDLATGTPVKDAKVSIYVGTLIDIKKPQPSDIVSTSQTSEYGVATLAGTEQLDPYIKLAYNYRRDDKKLFVLVEKGDDMALLPLNYDFQIDTYRASGEKFWSARSSKYQHMVSWGTSAQGVYRTGEKAQFKLYVRNNNNNKLDQPYKGRYDLEVYDPTNKMIHQFKAIQLNEFGAYSGEFTVPKNGAVGWYNFELKGYYDGANPETETPSKPGEAKENQPSVRLYPFSVLISDFTPSPFKVTVEADAALIMPQQQVTFATAAKLHSGGAYTDAKAELTVLLQGESFRSKHPVAENFFFGAPQANERDLMIVKKAGTVDSKGEYEIKHQVPVQPSFYGKVLLEGKVSDDRGKSVATHKTIHYIGGNRLVGILQKQWIYKAKAAADMELLVINERGEPVAGTAEVKVLRKDTSIAKVKSAGNAYKANANHEWVDVRKDSLTLKAEPLAYNFTPEEAGSYKIIATTKDEKGREHLCETEIYVSGSDYVLWGEETDTSLPIIPKKSEYKVGEIAEFMVKNPYPNVQALITVERLGVIDTFVKTLDSNTPIIEIPVKADYLPNFYVSVAILSPRVEQKPLAVGQLDLGKPAFRMGYARINVIDLYKEIVVTAKSDKDVYKPREKVKLELTAAPRHVDGVKEPIELAVVVIDDAVFDLIQGGRNYYDPYKGFYKDQGLEVQNYSLLNALIGRMKFEKKGANPGGDGGMDLSLRNVFKFVSYWNPSLRVDANGKANVEFEAPDNLTGWRVLVMAMSPTDRMGLGESTFKVNRETETRPVMPNQIAEGDKFMAGFSVTNRTDKQRDIAVTIKASGTVQGQGLLTYTQTVTLEPYKRTTVYMPIQSGNVGAEEQGTITFDVTAGDAIDTDKVAHTLNVTKVRVLETVASSGTTVAAQTKIPILIPNDIYTDVGNLNITLSPSMINNIGGVFSYMKVYPYNCWEQKLSRAIIAGHYPALKKYIGNQFDWPNSGQFVKDILDDATTAQASNGGMAYFRATDEYVDPFLSAFTALGFSWLKQQGHEIPQFVEERLLGYLSGLLKNDFVEPYYSQAMVATTRAVVLEALAGYGKLAKADLERFLPSVAMMNAYGKAAFVKAALAVAGAEDMADTVAAALLSHFNETPSKMTWAEDLDTSMLRILDTPLRAACCALDALTLYSTTAKGRTVVGDKAAKFAKAVTEARKSKLHWENTQENLYCARALASYSKVYESGQPKLEIAVAKGEELLGKVGFSELTDPSIVVSSKFTAQDLGKDTSVNLTKDGEGRFYYTTQLQYARKTIDLREVNSGLEVRREYSVLRDNKWVLLEKGVKLSRGEVVRVDLYVIAPADRSFVVVNDPVPGCLEPVNKNLATAALMDQRQLNDQPAEGAWWYKLKDWVDYNAMRWSFYHKELRHESVRFYADYLPKGNYYLSYVAQVIADGEFVVAPTHAEEMYNPETFGRGVTAEITVATVN